MRIGILGGGLTGLTLATLLQKYHDVEVLEASSSPGGLCRSFETNGFRGDYGGHILFSKDKDALAFLLNILQKNVHEVRRENRILYKEIFVKYPFENDLASLPAEERYNCLYNFLYNSSDSDGPVNLKEWIYSTFGKGIAEKYLLPYNQKIWKTLPEKLSISWVERIPKPPKEDVIKSALGIPTEGYTHQLYFYYPISGGIEALISAMAKNITIINNFRVISIHHNSSGWTAQNERGESCQYDQIVSTIPIFELFDAVEQVDPYIHSLVRKLRYNSIIVVLVCLSTPRRYNFSAIYVPDTNTIFHRICYMDYFSNQNSPEGCSSILAEITTNNKDDVAEMSEDQIRNVVVDNLVRLGLIDRKDVIDVCMKKQEYGYVVNDLEYEERLRTIHSYLNQIGLPFCGRFAEFRYLNMDACVRSAFEVVRKNFQS